MDSSPTLQDFVLNLIYDPAARTAFEIDPEKVLADAGLGDVTAADVQEVIPLVVDYAPLPTAAFATPLGSPDGATGVGDADVTAGIFHLQAMSASFAPGAHGAPEVSFAGAGAGAVIVSTDGLLSAAPAATVGVEHSVSVHTSVPAPAGDALSGVHDPGLGLDAVFPTSTNAPATSIGDAHDLIASTGVDAGAALDSGSLITGDALDGTHGIVGGLTSSIGINDATDLDATHLDPAGSSVVGSVTGSDPLGAVSHDATQGVLDATSHVTSPVSGLVSGLDHHTAPDAVHDAHGVLGGLLP
jgi:hypothetical protein